MEANREMFDAAVLVVLRSLLPLTPTTIVILYDSRTKRAKPLIICRFGRVAELAPPDSHGDRHPV